MPHANVIAEDRAADLHYAFQSGENSIRALVNESGRASLKIYTEFLEKFSGDKEALAEYNKGVIAEKLVHGLE